MSEKPRIVLRIEPRTDGRFAILYGDNIRLIADRRADAEGARRIWQADIDAGQMPRVTGDFAVRAGIAALRAEIEALRAARDHVAISSRGGERRQEARREADEPPWVAEGKKIAKKAREVDKTVASHAIAKQIRVVCETMGCPDVRMLENHILQWERDGEVTPKVKAPLYKRK
jgi:hypothetical protein